MASLCWSVTPLFPRKSGGKTTPAEGSGRGPVLTAATLFISNQLRGDFPIYPQFQRKKRERGRAEKKREEKERESKPNVKVNESMSFGQIPPLATVEAGRQKGQNEKNDGIMHTSAGPNGTNKRCANQVANLQALR